MKTKFLLISFCMLLIACNKQPKKVITYSPQAKGEGKSVVDYDCAIAEKRALMNGRLDSVTYSHAIKLSVMVPKPNEVLSEPAIDALGSKMLNITATNGVAGYGGDPSFVFAALVTPQKCGLTSTVPQKRYITYLINFYVVNIATGSVFGSTTYEIMGVGDSNELASINAMQSIQSNSQLNELLAISSKKIIAWYESHAKAISQRIDGYAQLGEYDKAYAVLSSIPEEATTCYAYAAKIRASIYEKYMEQQSLMFYNNMREAMALNEEQYNPIVGAYMLMIPHTASIYPKASEDFDNYISKINDIADARRAHSMYMEEEQMAISKIQAESELRANEALKIQAEKDLELAKKQEIQGEHTNSDEDLFDFSSLTGFGMQEILYFLFW